MVLQNEGSFVATDDDGQPYTVVIHRHVSDTGAQLDPRSAAPGNLILRTTDGKKVNRINKGHYEIESQPNIPIYSNDPTAP